MSLEVTTLAAVARKSRWVIGVVLAVTASTADD
jgi:hypothetical protein